jgi:peptidyl-prolyl cis-trans isomerase SurA
MINRAVLLLLCSGIFTLSLAQNRNSKKSSSKNISLFSVNRKDVSADEFIYLYRKNHQKAKDDFTKDKIEEYLSLYTNFKLKVEEARKRGMDTTAAFKKEFNQYKEELRKPYLPGNNLTDSLVKMTYNRMKEEVRASHILVSLSPDATPSDTAKAYAKISEIRTRILSGEDFAKVASESSEDPSAKTNFGDLGYFTALQMVYPFESAAFTTPVGEVSKPVRSRFGYHILKVVDKRPTRGEVEVSHIMVRTGDSKNNDQAKNIIFEVYDKLQAGVAWAELCKQYSEDPSSKENGGKLNPFKVGGMSNVPEFERVSFELEKPGQISDPVQTQYGWHIIRLERKIPLASFEEMTPTLRSRVMRDERSQISKQALQTKLRKDLGLVEFISVKNDVLAAADTTLQTAEWVPVLKKPQVLASGLFELNKKIFKVNDFLKFAIKSQKPNSQEPQRYLEQLYNNYIDEQMMIIQEENILQKNPEYKYLLNEYYEGILLFEIMEKEVWNKASEDSVGQYRYFEKNAAKYQASDRLKGTFYSTPQKDLIDPLKVLVDQGDHQKILEFVSKNKIKSESGYYKKADKAILQQVKWEKGVYPVENNGMYYLAWIKEILPAGQMSFEEARPTLISDYQNFLEESWVSELRKKYPVRVNEKGKKFVFQQLQNN